MRAARTDDNQKAIVKALRKLGASVAVTSSMGDGFPDLVVGFRTKNYLIECKDGKKPPSERKLTEDQEKFHATWYGTAHVANSVDEAVQIVTGPQGDK